MTRIAHTQSLRRGYATVAATSLVSLLALGPGPCDAADDIPAPARQRYAGEVLVASHPEGWELADHARTGFQEMREYLPVGQTVKQWTEMLTVTIWHGITDLAPEDVQDQLDRIGVAACPGQVNKRLFNSEERGYRIAVSVDVCGKYAETGMGEITMFKVIRGRDSLYQVHRSLRVPAFEVGPELPMSSQQFKAWAEFFRTQVFVCDTRIPDSCPADLRP